MTRVEELRKALNGLIGDVVRQMPLNVYGNPDDTIPPAIDSLISAARAEGSAEGHAADVGKLTTWFRETFAMGRARGTEQERERIRKWLYEPDPANPGYHIHINILGELEFITPFDLLSVLDSPIFPPVPMGNLPGVYGDALPIKEPPCKS